MADAALDQDALLKAACYGLVTEILRAVPVPPHAYGVLGTARFVLPKKIEKRQLNDKVSALAALQQALAALETLEPTEDEIRLAAAIEFEASRQQQPVHGGECLLSAMLIQRDLHHVLTGDKQAIRGLAALVLPVGASVSSLAEKWVCFEQAIAWLCQLLGAATVRAHVCAEPRADTGLRICFSCASPEIDEASWWEGLHSNISDVRSATRGLLMAGPD